MQLGSCEVQIVSGGKLKLDGGNMFGPVPRVLWEKKITPDGRHRIAMETNALLVEAGAERILIDSGYGSKADARQRDYQGLDEGNPIVDHLAAIGCHPHDITMVVLTHLHFDHAGGCTRFNDEGDLEPVFPKARHFVQRIEWEDAMSNRPELSGSYFRNDFSVLAERGLIELVDGNASITGDVRVRLVGGHTRGMQIVELGRSSEGKPLGYALADLVPSTLHLKTFWHVAYDQYPVELRQIKPVILGEVADRGACAFFCHDTVTPWAYLKRDAKQEFEVDQRLPSGMNEAR